MNQEWLQKGYGWIQKVFFITVMVDQMLKRAYNALERKSDESYEKARKLSLRLKLQYE